MSRVVKFSLQNFATNLFLLPVGLAISVVVARQLGPHDKGIYNYIAVIAFTFVPMFLLGTGGATIYYISSGKYTIKEVFLSNFFISILHGTFTVSLLLLLFHFDLLGKSLQNISFTIIILLLCIIMFHTFYLLMNQVLMALSRFPLLNKITLAKSLLTLLAFTAVLYVFGYGLSEVLISMLLILVLLDLYLFYYVIKNFKPEFCIRRDYIKDLYKFGIKVWAGNIANQANAQLDQLMLGYLTSPSNLGMYTVGYRMGSMINIPISSTFAVFYNIIASEKKTENQRHTLFKVHRIFFTLSVIGAIFLIFLGPFLINMLYGPAFADATGVLVLVIPGIIFYGTTRRLVQKYFTAQGLPAISSIIEISGALLGLVFYLLLIPEFQLFGAAVATTLGYLGSTGVSIFYLVRKKHFTASEFFLIKWKDIYWFKQTVTNLVKYKKIS